MIERRRKRNNNTYTQEQQQDQSFFSKGIFSLSALLVLLPCLRPELARGGKVINFLLSDFKRYNFQPEWSVSFLCFSIKKCQKLSLSHTHTEREREWNQNEPEKTCQLHYVYSHIQTLLRFIIPHNKCKAIRDYSLFYSCSQLARERERGSIFWINQPIEKGQQADLPI